MFVRICGHVVHWQKPIKIYTYLKTLAVLMALGYVFVSTPLYAADCPPSSSYKASPVEAVPCLPLHTPRMENQLPVQESGFERTQRPAGSSSVSALAVMMALGLTNVQGPIERTAVRPAQNASPNSGMATQPRIAMER